VHIPTNLVIIWRTSIVSGRRVTRPDCRVMTQA
jgi:hypothetical protein